MVGENDFHLGTAGSDQITIVAHIVNSGKFMTVFTKELPICFQAQDIAVRIDSGFIQLIDGYQLVSNLIAWVAQHQNDLFRPLCNSLQTDCKPVTAQDREHNTNGFSSQLFLNISGNCIH